MGFVQGVKTIIDEYCAISGQKVKFHISLPSYENGIQSDKNMIQSVLGITCMTNLEKYLGYPIINGRGNKTTFNELLENTGKQLSKWKANLISQAGRSVLINSNLSAKPNFVMQSFTLPSQVHKELDQTNRCFCYNKEQNQSLLIWWDKICKPKKFYGLGLRKAADINKVLQMKLMWKILAEPENW